MVPCGAEGSSSRRGWPFVCSFGQVNLGGTVPCSCLGSSTPWKFCRQLTRARTQALRPRALSPFICKKTLPCCHVCPTGPNCGCLLFSKAGILFSRWDGRGREGGTEASPSGLHACPALPILTFVCLLHSHTTTLNMANRTTKLKKKNNISSHHTFSNKALKQKQETRGPIALTRGT